MSEADLAAYAILLQILTVTYAVNMLLPDCCMVVDFFLCCKGSYGLSLAGTVQVGYWLGAGKPNEAKQAAWLAIKLNCIN